MKKNLIHGLNMLGIILIGVSLLIHFEVYDKEVFEIVRLTIISLYVVGAVLLPWFEQSSIRKKVISIVCLSVYPIGVLNAAWWYVSAAVVFIAVYLFVVHDCFDEKSHIEI